MPESVEVIEDEAFFNMNSLKEIRVDYENKYYRSIDGNLYSKDGKKLLQYTTNTRKYEKLPEGLEELAINSFIWSKAEVIKLPLSLKEVKNDIFISSAIKEIYIPKYVLRIDAEAFIRADGLISINVDCENENYMSIDGNLYSKDGKALLAYARGKKDAIFKIPNGVEKINSTAFSRVKLEKLIIPKSLKSIEKYVFENLMVNEIVLEEGIERIEEYAFDYSTVKYINIPSSIKYLSKKAFHGCKNLINKEN